MQIREASDSDIPGILEVLKASLGESSSKKTAEVWRYKHIDNPFGTSLVLLAEENGRIIGVRAFMRWQWQEGTKVYKAFRAVDTATHPKHQGKGIFKKLTLAALKLAEEKGHDFIFNTPNEQSKPGYLKMGWEEIGKLKVSVKPSFNLRSKAFQYEQNIIREGLDSYALANFNKEQQEKQKLFTPKNKEYLNWRYKNCKLQDYFIYEDKDLFVAVYLKNRSRINELRVAELILLDSNSRKKLNKLLKNYAKKTGAQLITASPGVLSWSITSNFGPVLTQKHLSLKSERQFDNKGLGFWNYQLGDLELF